jgi:hypothetical protein
LPTKQSKAETLTESNWGNKFQSVFINIQMLLKDTKEYYY